MPNKLFLSTKSIEIVCDRNSDETRELVALFYPVTSNRLKTTFKLSPHLIPEVLKVFRNIDESNISTTPEAIQKLYAAEMLARDNTAELLKNGPRRAGMVTPLLTLDPHQQLGREIAEYNNRFAFFYDTRTGKTPLALSIMYDDLQKNPTHKWLVICPLILIHNAWLEDAAKFMPEIKVVNCHAATAAKRLKALQTPGQIFLTNTESFINYKEHFEQLGVVGCFVDESSDIKSASSKVSSAVVEFAQTVKRFYLLAGTPAPNGEWEYYMQMRAIDYYGWQSSNTQFELHYFVNMSYNSDYKKLCVRPDKKEQLMDKVKTVSMFLDKEDVLNTPGRVFIPIEYDMPDELKQSYMLMKDKLYVELKDEIGETATKILAMNIGVKLNKLNQISSGFIMDTLAAKENKFCGTTLSEWYLLDDKRFKVLQDLLDSDGVRGESVLIWANYRKEFEIIRGILGARCACVYGGVSNDEKNNAIALFKNKQVQYLVANPASADKGLTLTVAHIAIYFSLNWSYELFKQSMERIYGDKRIQPLPCVYYVILANGTIDKILYEDVLQGKQEASYKVLNHLKPEVVFK